MLTNTQEETVEQIAARLIVAGMTAGDGAVLSIEPIGVGRNSQVYKVLADGKRVYALKSYFRHATDSRDRLWTEFAGLQFLWRNGIRVIPQPLAVDREHSYALYEYIDGRTITAGSITNEEIEVAVAFLARLKDLRERPGSRELPIASEACFSQQELMNNLRLRLKRLLDYHNQQSGDLTLKAFLADEFMPAFDIISKWSCSGYPCQQELAWAERTLSPSDFGFHNALRRNNGQWIFLDFEYFGWDDPAKTLSDFLLHPAMKLTENLKRQFAVGMLRLFVDSPGFAERVKSVYPLFGLKWCLILMNEFLPEHLLRRQFAGTDNRDRQTVQREQLSKTRGMLQRIHGEYENFPYFN